ncbi:MAG: type II secretion system protein [Mariprofundaceae bacterium]
MKQIPSNSIIKKQNNDRGFTLIEIMVVVGIIGILASIAVPLFNQYRTKAYDASAKVQVHNIVLTEQAYFSTEGSYLSVAAGVGPGAMGVLPNQNASTGVGYIVYLPNGVNSANFTAYTGHQNGTRVFAASENNGPLWKIKAAGSSADQDAQAQPNTVLVDAWGSR